MPQARAGGLAGKMTQNCARSGARRELSHFYRFGTPLPLPDDAASGRLRFCPFNLMFVCAGKRGKKRNPNIVPNNPISQPFYSIRFFRVPRPFSKLKYKI
jgi:hypothetical protein